MTYCFLTRQKYPLLLTAQTYRLNVCSDLVHILHMRTHGGVRGLASCQIKPYKESNSLLHFWWADDFTGVSSSYSLSQYWMDAFLWVWAIIVSNIYGTDKFSHLPRSFWLRLIHISNFLSYPFSSRQFPNLHKVLTSIIWTRLFDFFHSQYRATWAICPIAFSELEVKDSSSSVAWFWHMSNLTSQKSEIRLTMLQGILSKWWRISRSDQAHPHRGPQVDSSPVLYMQL